MIFSLFRGDKETINPEYFRVEMSDSFAEQYGILVELEIWALFVERHKNYGGILPDAEIKCFISEAMEMGFNVRPIV